jgi:release factor glutamine methyltransferase
MTAAQALAPAIARLRVAGVPAPATDARRLMAHALGVHPDRLTLHLAEPLPPAVAARFEAAIAARATRRPLSQIIGRRLFWGRSFRVTSDVLDPRPETETLIAAALRAPFSRVLDLGAGSGCILLTLLAERPAATGLGIDSSAAALAVARANAADLGLEARAVFRQGDWCAGLDERFDLIVSNPPYVAAEEIAALAPEVRDWEPRAALVAGADALAAYRAICAAAPALLTPGGRLMVEIGPTQGDAVAALFTDAGLTAVTVLPDLDGRPRVVAGQTRDRAATQPPAPGNSPPNWQFF